MTDVNASYWDIARLEQEATELDRAVRKGDDAARLRFRWNHPRFENASMTELRQATPTLEDAREVVAREQAFGGWGDAISFMERAAKNSEVREFEVAADAVVSGDIQELEALLQANPELVTSRSIRRHAATLLHYVGANGIEEQRQRTPSNAVNVAMLLLDRGAAVDALAEFYGERCTTLSMIVSSAHPAKAGLQIPLAEALLDHGAAMEGPGTAYRSAVLTALIFGYADTAQALARRRSTTEPGLVVSAGLGWFDEFRRRLPGAPAEERRQALALAALHGRPGVVEALLDSGENPNRYNPPGFHPHCTPLHQAALGGHEDVVRLLLARGARPDSRDTIYEATPLEWALHNEQRGVAKLLQNGY